MFRKANISHYMVSSYMASIKVITSLSPLMVCVVFMPLSLFLGTLIVSAYQAIPTKQLNHLLKQEQYIAASYRKDVL